MTTPLATVDDVSSALGLIGDNTLTQAQQARAIPLLALVSRRFRLEAGRVFTPGTYTHTFKIHRGAIRLMETPTEVTSVTVSGVTTQPGYTVERDWVLFDDWESQSLNGRDVTVVYSWTAEVPTAVVAAVASIVARTLTVDPNSIVAQASQLTTPDYSMSVAPWARDASVSAMSEDDIDLARSFRKPRAAPIVHQMGPIG